MIPIGKVFKFFHLDDNPQIPLGLLYGPDAFVGNEHKITWAEFACCAFYYKLQAFEWPGDRVVGICQIAYPQIKKNIEDLAKGKALPMIVLLIDNEFMLSGEDYLYDMKTWQELDKAEFEQRNLFQVSVCFMVSSTAIIEAGRFLKKEPKYARDCPFVKQPDDPIGVD